MDQDIKILFSVVGGILVVASVIGAVMKLRVKTEAGRATVANLNARTRSWWCRATAKTFLKRLRSSG